MQLENTFTIEAPLEKAWEALNTPETVAPVLPRRDPDRVRG